MVVGESPGPEEDKIGRPFIGMSGKLLMRMFLHAHGTPLKDIPGISDNMKHLQVYLDKDLEPLQEAEASSTKEVPYQWEYLRDILCRHIYFTNAAMCYRETPKPTQKELHTCRDRLMAEIYLIDPQVILSVGLFAFKSLTGFKDKSPITKMHGFSQTITIPGKAIDTPYTMVPIVHPSFILREGGDKSPWLEKTFNVIAKTVACLGGVRELGNK